MSVAGQEASVAAAPRPLHNALALTAATLAAKGCGFLLFTVAVRVLGPSEFGLYSTVMALVAVFAVGTDVGLSTLAVRDAAQNHVLLPRYLSNVLALRLLLALLMAALCVLSSVLLRYNLAARLGVVIWALALVPVAVVGTMTIVFQAIERLTVVSVLTAATAALTAFGGLVALALGGRVIALIAVAAAVNTVAALVAAVLATRATPLRLRVEPAWWPHLIRAAAPFSVLSVLNVLYSRADAVLLYSLGGAVAAGLYGVTYRLVDTLLVVVISPFNAAALPAFNRVAAASGERLHRLIVSGVRIMLGVGVPVAVVVTIYATPLLHLVAGPGHYDEAVAALQWLVWSFPCFTVLAILYNALYALHRARDVGRIFAVTLVFNVVGNLVLIPRYSYLASAVLTTTSELLNVVLAFVVVRRLSGPIPLLRTTLCVVVAALAMIVVAESLRPRGPFIGAPIAGVTYLLVLWLMQAAGPDERAILAHLPLVGPALARLLSHPPSLPRAVSGGRKSRASD